MKKYERARSVLDNCVFNWRVMKREALRVFRDFNFFAREQELELKFEEEQRALKEQQEAAQFREEGEKRAQRRDRGIVAVALVVVTATSSPSKKQKQP